MSADSGLAMLLAEDFDHLATAAAPDIEALLVAAREEARDELAAAFDTRAAEAQEALARACVALAENLAPALDSLDATLVETATALTEAMLASLCAAVPAWRQRFAPQANAEIAARVMQALGEVASPCLFAARADIDALRALLPEGVALEPDPAMKPGALRLAWREGHAESDPAALWNEIETILAAALAPACAPE